MNDALSRFIEHARQRGMDFSTIHLLLRAGGWKDAEIAGGIAARELGVPIPERAGVGSARDAFFHLLAFTALYAWVISLIYLLFSYIEFAFPDEAFPEPTYAIESAQSGMRASLATLIISFPLFVLVWWYLLHEIRRWPEKAKSEMRRWLTFLTLFVGAVTISADVITAVYYLVEGELTVRFLAKVVALLVVTAGLCIYFALTLKSEAEATA